MKNVKAAFATFVLGCSTITAPAFALKHDGPPYIRTGQDLADACKEDRPGAVYICAGMYAAIADTTEAARWKNSECPPAIVQSADPSIPLEFNRMRYAEERHPDWLKLPVAAFVDKAERLARCSKE